VLQIFAVSLRNEEVISAESKENMESPTVGSMRSSHSWPHDMRKGQGNKPVLSSFHELWNDGLLCAYEFIPGAKKRHRAGSKLGEHTGHNNQVKFDAELHVHEPQSLLQLVALGSDESPMRSLEAQPHGNEQHNELEGKKRSLASKSGDNQGELKGTNESVSGHWSLPAGRNLQHPRKKEAGNHWVPISWDRLAELVATVQVCVCLSLSFICSQGIMQSVC
jgi:hypothetical protein